MDTLPNTEPTIVTGVCECCPTEGPLFKYIDILMCKECYEKEVEVSRTYQSEDAQIERLQAAKNVEAVYLEQIRQENAALRVSSDIFNAKIRAISDLKKAIDADPSVENKNFTLARVLGERFQHLTGLLHEKRQEIAEAENEQRAIQSFYNELSKSLRVEEREKLKLADLTYKPAPVPVKVKKEPPKKKWDKTGVAAAALLSGIPEQMIQLTCVSRDITPEAAVMILKEMGMGKK